MNKNRTALNISPVKTSGKEGLWDRRAKKAGYRNWLDYWRQLENDASMTGVYQILTPREIRSTPDGGGMGLCPFHDDRTPSFSILPGDKRFYCHAASCRARGSVFDFIRRMHGWSLAQATFWLAGELKLPQVHLPGTSAPVASQKEHQKVETPQSMARNVRQFRSPSGQDETGYGDLLSPPEEKLPQNNETLVAWHPVRKRWQNCQVDHWHVYRDKTGQPLLLIGRRNARFNTPKRFVRLTWRALGRTHPARPGWILVGWPNGQPAPLYGADRLGIHAQEVRNRIRPSLHILVVEGEMTCEAGQRLLTPDWCVLTALGGSQAVLRGHWQDIVASWQEIVTYATAQMRVVIWPDADWSTRDRDPAAEFVQNIENSLAKSFGNDVASRNLCRLEVVWPQQDWPKGFDLADLHKDARPWVQQQLDRAELQRWQPARGVA